MSILPHIDTTMVIATKKTIVMLVNNGKPVASVTAADKQAIAKVNLRTIIRPPLLLL